MQLKSNYITRREFLAACGVAGLTMSLGGLANSQNAGRARELLVYIGTYTSGESKSEGIYICKLNPDSGALSLYRTVRGVEEPSFLAIDKGRKSLYAVNETVEYQGQKSGAVSAFAIDRKTGDLRFLNKQPSLGGAPCHVSVSDSGKFVLVANYLGGNAAVFPVEKDGRLGAAIDIEQHSVSGPNKERQKPPHAHSIVLDGKNRFAFVNDLGLDKVMIYRFDAKSGKLEPNAAQPFYETRPGAGPRHFKFHPNGKLAFVINELDMTVSSLAYDPKQGSLKEVHTLSTLPAGFSGANSCADIHVSPDGAFLYGSNRGHDSIVSYRIDDRTGKLEPIEHVPTRGKTPRNFAVDPTGKFLLVANQKSDSVVVFRIDGRSGELRPTGNKISVPSPVCLKLVPMWFLPNGV